MQVDKSIRLVGIIGMDPDWEVCHRILALEIDGKSQALSGLQDLKKYHRDDYKKIMKVIQLVASEDRVKTAVHVKRGRKGSSVYEMRGGNARLFFFYAPNDEIVVCTNLYWKAKPSTNEQNAAFGRCEALRQIYLNSLSVHRG